MSEEIEDGEVNSDSEQHTNDNNPYEEEDEMMIELKIKALQSLLEKEEDRNNEVIKSTKKAKLFRRKTKLNKKRKKNLMKKETTESEALVSPLTNEPQIPSLLSINAKPFNTSSNHFNQFNDNYDVQDMEIESNNLNQMLNQPTFNSTSSFNTLTTQFNQPSFYTNFSQSTNDLLNQSNSNFLANWSNTLTSMFENFYQSTSSFSHQLSTGFSPSLLQPFNQQPLTQPQPQSIKSPQSSKYSRFKNNKQRLNGNKKTNQNLQRKKSSFNNISVDCNTSVLPASSKPVIFTLSSPEPSPPIKQQPTTTINLDVDERFIDSTTSKLDIDYRQHSEKLIEEEKLLREILINSINEKKKQKDEQNDKKEESKDDEDMEQLRQNILSNLNQKRKEKEQEQVKQMDQDYSKLKQKVIEHEQELISSEPVKLVKQTIATTIQQVPQQVTQSVPKINPVIIHLNSLSNDETSDNDSDSDDLKSNINQFLKEAKQQAAEQSLSNVKITESNKEKITKLRDEINSNSKEITELTRKSNELKQMKTKKDKDIELTKQKINTLREQLLAAEKIFNANEASLNLVKLQIKSNDIKLNKLINLKKVQQADLQKLLSQNQQSKPASNQTQRIVQVPEPVQRRVVLMEPPPLPTQPPPPLPPPPPPSPEISLKTSESTEKLKQSVLTNKKLPVQMTLGGVVAQRNQKRTNQFLFRNSDTQNTRPNLYISKKTDKNLEKIAATTTMHIQVTHQQSDATHQIVTTKVVDEANLKTNPFKLRNISNKKSPVKNKDDSKLSNLETLQKLNEFLAQLIESNSTNHCESLDIWCYESTSSFTFKDVKSLDYKMIDFPLPETTSCYKNESFNNSCNASSNTIYPIGEVNNYESPLKCFKGYRFSSHFVKLNSIEDTYSKFYCNSIDISKPFCPYDLHGSCKDSQCVYQHLNVMTMDNLQRTEHLLSYCPQLLNLSSNPNSKEANKKLKAYAKQFMNSNLNKMSIKDYFQYLYDQIVSNLKLEPTYSTILSRIPALCTNNNKSLTRFDFNTTSPNHLASGESLLHIFDTILSFNLNRQLEIKLKNLEFNNQLDIEWLKTEQENLAYFNDLNELVLAWLYLGRLTYLNESSVQKLLNILSHSLELNPKNELVWLVYLRTYLSQSNSLNDYHEICLLCMDNLVTYDLVWFILNTCLPQYLNLIIERYENHLLFIDSLSKLNEFEQFSTNNETNLKKISFYLFELIVFKVSFNKSSMLNDLRRNEIVKRLDANDLCLLWLLALHLEIFNSFPPMVKLNQLFNSRVNKQFNSKAFWLVDPINHWRTFNRMLFTNLNTLYENGEKQIKPIRSLDSFLIPWNFKLNNSIDQMQHLIHEALKSISQQLNTQKQKARLCSLPIYINLICLEVANKRSDVANKLCDRLLKANDLEALKELNISQIYIQIKLNLSTADTIIESAVKIFSSDPHLIFLAAQYYSINNKVEKAIELCENLTNKLKYAEQELNSSSKFKLILGLSNNNKKGESIKLEPTEFISYAVLYCFYLQLLNTSESELCQLYEEIISKIRLISHKAIMWTRYFKYMSTSQTLMNQVFNLVKKCIKDLNQSVVDKNHLIPFYYLNLERKTDFNKLEASENEFDLNDLDYYYQNCLIDLWLKLFCKNLNEKYLFSKFLLELIPFNQDLIKLFVNYSLKLNGSKSTLQFVYNHLSMNSIDCDYLWILCIKMCIDINDLHQAIQIYQKAQATCSRTQILSQLNPYLFSTDNTSKLVINN